MSDLRWDMILIALVYLGLFILILWAAYQQHRADRNARLALIKEHEADKLKNEKEIDSMSDAELVEFSNERNRRIIRARSNSKKE